MLPTFPKAQKELDEAFFKRMFDWKNKTFPLHRVYAKRALMKIPLLEDYEKQAV